MLVRSLLALGALIAAADANAWQMYGVGPGCAGFKMATLVSDNTQKEVKFDLTVPGEGPLHDIPNNCQGPGEIIQFQSIEVCNDYKGLTSSPRKPPTIHYMTDTTYSPIYASCNRAPECGPLLIHVTQRCNKIQPLGNY